MWTQLILCSVMLGIGPEVVAYLNVYMVIRDITARRYGSYIIQRKMMKKRTICQKITLWMPDDCIKKNKEQYRSCRRCVRVILILLCISLCLFSAFACHIASITDMEEFDDFFFRVMVVYIIKFVVVDSILLLYAMTSLMNVLSETSAIREKMDLIIVYEGDLESEAESVRWCNEEILSAKKEREKLEGTLSEAEQEEWQEYLSNLQEEKAMHEEAYQYAQNELERLRQEICSDE